MSIPVHNPIVQVSGELAAALHRDPTVGMTRLGRCYHRYPLKVTKTFDLPYGQLGLYMMDISPGIMSGDRYSIDFQLNADSAAYISTQSHTKVHPALPGQQSVLRQRLVLGERAFLEYDPEPTIFYRGAKLHTETEVHMAPGSALVLSDIFCAGRLARGERFQFALYDNRLRVYFADELIYYNRMRLEPTVQEPAKLGLFGSYSHLGTMLIVAESVDERLVAQLRTAVAVAAGDFDLQVGISQTYKHGILINVLGHHAWQIAQILAEIRIYARARLRSWGPLRLGK